VQYDLRPWANPFLTALHLKQDLGSVKITHPYHPLSGKEFQVLKTRKVGGKFTLLLKENERGSFAVPMEWTSYYHSDQDVSPIPDTFISVESLLSLCELIKKNL
jgi:hypothetical protein